MNSGAGSSGGRALAVVVGVLILFAAVVAGLRGGGGAASGARQAATGTPRSECVGVVVVSSQEKSALLGSIAAAYDARGPKLGGRCVDVRVNMLASGSAEQALSGDWSAHGLGPAPTVWSPAARSWIELLRGDRAGRDGPDILPSDTPSLMQSPLVLAMPRPMAEAMGWPNTPVGWSDLLKLAQDPTGWGRYGHPEWGRFQLGKTSPDQSTSGLHALLAAYYAATGVSADLTVKNVDDPQSRAFVKGVETSVLHYGSTVSAFLDALKAADDRGQAMAYVSAIATEETQVLAYDGAHPKTPLVAVYPKDGTLVADHPFAVLNASWVTEAQRQAAAAFLDWLLQPAQQATFLRAGFRDHEGHADPRLTTGDGIAPAGPPLVLHVPTAAVLSAVRDSWQDVRKRARVLIVLDTSGSMAGDKMAAVKRAATAALEAFAPDDEVGLWNFSSQIVRDEEIASVASARPRLEADINGLNADGGTALYRVTQEAVKTTGAGWDAARVNAVLLLTDGQNEDSYADLDATLRLLGAQPPSRSVPVFAIAYGQDADLDTLKKIAAASHGRAYNAPDPTQVGGVFADVISNF